MFIFILFLVGFIFGFFVKSQEVNRLQKEVNGLKYYQKNIVKDIKNFTPCVCPTDACLMFWDELQDY